MNASNDPGITSEEREVLLVEYQAAQSSAQHHDQLVWTVTSIVWGSNLVLLGVIPAIPDGVYAYLIKLGFCVLGPSLIVFVWSSQFQFRSLKRQSYARCKAIEKQLGMHHHQSAEYDRGSQSLLYGVISAVFVVVWLLVALATLARGEGSVANNRVNALCATLTSRKAPWTYTHRYEVTMKAEFTAVFQKVPEGYIGFVEELPGANTQGSTLEEARKNLAEAAELVLEANRELSQEDTRGQSVIREPLKLPAA